MAKDAEVLYGDNKDSDQTVDVQADLNLRWKHMSEGKFSHVAAQIFISHQAERGHRVCQNRKCKGQPVLSMLSEYCLGWLNSCGSLLLKFKSFYQTALWYRLIKPLKKYHGHFQQTVVYI